MRVGFPRLGSFHVFLKPAFRPLGIDLCEAPPSSRRTLDLGVKKNPETICTPCKLLFGNYVEVLEQGVESLVMFGGPGTCRLGYSARLQESYLHQMGFEFAPYTVDLYHLPAETLRFLRTLAQPTLAELVETLRFLLALIELVDDIERATLRIRPLERQTGTVDRLREKALAEVLALPDRGKLNESRDELLRPFQQVPCREQDPLRIALVGDLYTMLEPFFNLGLEQALGRLGVHVKRSFWLSEMSRNMLQAALLHRGHTIERLKAGTPYLARNIGGFAQSTVGEAALFAEGDVDGLIHLAPFNCTPEVMAHNVLLSMQRERGIPFLSLSFDEQSGRAGLLTRLEAFVDILERRRERRPAPDPPTGWRTWVSFPLSGVIQDLEGKLSEVATTVLKDFTTRESGQATTSRNRSDIQAEKDQ